MHQEVWLGIAISTYRCSKDRKRGQSAGRTRRQAARQAEVALH